MSNTPKFDAITWTVGCGCGDTPTKAFAEIVKGAGGLLIRIAHDDTINVTQYGADGSKVRDSEPMTPEQVEALL